MLGVPTFGVGIHGCSAASTTNRAGAAGSDSPPRLGSLDGLVRPVYPRSVEALPPAHALASDATTSGTAAFAAGFMLAACSLRGRARHWSSGTPKLGLTRRALNLKQLIDRSGNQTAGRKLSRVPGGSTDTMAKSKDAVMSLGGKGNDIRYSGVVDTIETISAERDTSRWIPKHEHWFADVLDDEDGFGMLRQGDVVQVFITKFYRRREIKEWIQGVVFAVDSSRMRCAVCKVDDNTVIDVSIGKGLIKRREDDRNLLPDVMLKKVSEFRTSHDIEGLHAYALTLEEIPERSHAMAALAKMKALEEAQELVYHGPVNSFAKRALAHAWAETGDVEFALALREGIAAPLAAQMLVESLALGLGSVIQAERARLGDMFFENPTHLQALQRCVNKVDEALPLLEPYVESVKASKASREGLTQAFNQLLVACGKAFAPPVSFRTLEWLERFGVPKDSGTFEAIGYNVVKRVELIKRVWDLPTVPEEGVPEVVFAGRSNVGKSSLVNMLLGRRALAPTSARPGKTKTMDFFDTNNNCAGLPRFRLVDVPGLGYAKVSKELKLRWVELIGGYFATRESLKIVFHLVDAGLGEILPADREVWKLLAQARRQDYELCVVITKADNCLPSQIARFAERIQEALLQEGSSLAMNATIFACSSKSKLGKDTLWRKIWAAIGGYVYDVDSACPSPEAEAHARSGHRRAPWAQMSDDEDVQQGEAVGVMAGL